VLFVLLIALAVGLAACGSVPETEADLGSSELTEVEPTATPEPTATATPEPTPTPVGGATGQFLYTSSVREEFKMENGLFLNYTGYQLNMMDLVSEESGVLIDKDLMSEEMGVALARTRFSPSPDGSLIMVTASTKVTFNSFDEFENYIVSSDLRTMIPILDAGATFVNWTWSPDGSMLLGDTLIDNTKAVYLVNSDGSGLRKLAQSPAITSPVWSADSGKVYWLVAGLPVMLDLSAGDSEPGLVTGTPGSLATFSFSPDGQKAAYITTAGKLSVAGSDFSDPQEVGGTYISDTCQGRFPPRILEWSSDSQYLIVSTNICVTINKVLFPSTKTILLSVVDGSQLKSMHEDNGELCGWAPDGSFVFRTAGDEGRTLVIGDVEATNPDFILEDFSGSCPSWIQ
jgi:hypothetical protein